LENVRLQPDSKLKEQIYSDIFALLGEFKLFTEATALNFISNLENVDQTLYDFKQIEENDKNSKAKIQSFCSEKFHVTIKCVISMKEDKNLKESSLYESFTSDFKEISNLFKAYEFLMNGIIAYNETSEKTLNFRIPLARIITYKGYRMLILTRNPFVFAKEMLLIQGFYEQNYRISMKFLDDFSFFSEFLGINLMKNSKTGGVSEKMQVFQSQLCSENAYYYLIEPIELIPKDPKFNDDFNLRLRPELLFQSDNKLTDEEIFQDLIEEIENLKEIPLDSMKLSELFHNRGLPMRYLGEAYEKTDQVYLKEILKREIIARTCKRMLNTHLQDFMVTAQNQDEIAIDFLNLLFGFGQDTESFWTDLLPEEIQTYYLINLKITHEDIKEFLFYKVLYQCSLEIIPDVHLEFPNKNITPLKISDFDVFSMKSKGFSLKGMSFYYDLKKKSNIGITKDLMTCFHANLGLFNMNKLLGNVTSANEFGLNLIELYLRNENYEQARISLMKLLSNSETGVSPLIRCSFLQFKIHLAINANDFLEIFVFLLKTLEKNFGPFHPFHILLYLELAKYYKISRKFNDAIFLIKNALICASKVLGMKHWIFANIYEEMGDSYLLLENRENALFYWQKGYEIVRITGLGFKIAELLLRMNKLLEAKEFFLKILNKKGDFFKKDEKNSELLEKNERNQKKIKDFEESDIEILLNLSHISLILNEISDGEKYLNLALEIQRDDDFLIEYEEKLIKIGFFLASRRITQKNRKYIWIISRSVIECGERKVLKNEALEGLKEETKKHWNLLDFFKDFFNELGFICEKNEYINDSEYWRVYMKNLELKDPHNLKKSLKFLNYIIILVGENTFIEELMK